MFLRAQDALDSHVAFGELGSDGELGYGNLLVSVRGRHYPGAISAHPPSRLVYQVPLGLSAFRSHVAMNDSSESSACADFSLYADGELVAYAPRVRPFEPPRLVEADIRGASRIELVADASPWGGSHGLWLDPCLGLSKDFIRCALPGVRLRRPPAPLCTDKCVVAIVTPDYVDMADNFFGSLWKNGGCGDAAVVLLCPDVTRETQLLAERVNGTVFVMDVADRSTYAMKAAAYSAAQVVRANTYLIADVDMLVLQPIAGVFDACSAAPRDSVLICREQSDTPEQTAWSALFGGGHPYFGCDLDAHGLGIDRQRAERMFTVNGGFMVASRRALLGVENLMHDMLPNSAAWERERPEVKWREQGLLNLALARLGNTTELAPAYNLQLAVSSHGVDSPVMGSPVAELAGLPARVAHFNGVRGRAIYESVCLKFRGVPNMHFGGSAAPEQREADVLAAKAFRTCYRVSACAAFPTQDSYWDNSPVWSSMWKEVVSRTKPVVLELDCFAGAAGALVSRAAGAVGGTSTHLSQETRPPWLARTFATAAAGDVEANFSRTSKSDSKFDVIVLDTSENQRRIYTLLNIARSCLNPGGVVLLHDVAHPVNDVSVILDKAREMGYSDAPLTLLKHGGLYALRQSGGP